MTALFWVSLALLAYVYVGYALLMRVRATIHPNAVRSRLIEPHVSIIVCAHNEESRIGRRIENLLALDYPRAKVEILVGSDGSTDDTVAAAERYAPAVRVYAFRERRGKPAVINALAEKARGEVLLFADARQRFAPDALRALVANFADPSVGAVSGELVLVDRSGGATRRDIGFYWRYEKFIRMMESRSRSTVGATGAIYAIRRDQFSTIPDDTVLDDVVIPVRIARQGFRVVFEPRARAFDLVSATATEEFTRKARTIAGTFQLFALEPWLWDPRRNPLWFETMSHKTLRLLVPALHAALLVSTVATPEQAASQLALAGQAAFYAAALVGYAQRRARTRLAVFSVPYAVCLQGWATVVGFYRFVTGRQRVTWDRVEVKAQIPNPKAQI
jgi:cellulose synthase/poly-beta-1,6-N-acetylglucosamine synthase-like glycosyltransferase